MDALIKPHQQPETSKVEVYGPGPVINLQRFPSKRYGRIVPHIVQADSLITIKLHGCWLSLHNDKPLFLKPFTARNSGKGLFYIQK